MGQNEKQTAGGELSSLPRRIRFGDLPEWLALRQRAGNTISDRVIQEMLRNDWQNDLRDAANRGELMVRTEATGRPIGVAFDDGMILMDELRPFLEGRGLGHILTTPLVEFVDAELLGATEQAGKMGEPAVRTHAGRAVDDTSDDADDVTAKATAGGKEWKLRARKMAIEIVARNRSKNLYPNQRLIAEEIERNFRDQGVRGPKGTPLTAAYIKRHALKGISNVTA